MNDVFDYALCHVDSNKNTQIISEIIELRKQNEETIDEPFFIINIDQLIQSYNKWNQYLPYIRPFYAVKCNSNPIILYLRILVNLFHILIMQKIIILS